MKRVTTAVLAGVTVATLAYASASVLTVEAKPLQAGSDTVTCDADGVGVEWALETDDNSVYWATVTGIDAKCEGATLFVAVDGQRLTQNGTPITATSHKVKFETFGGNPAPENINDVKVWIG